MEGRGVAGVGDGDFGGGKSGFGAEKSHFGRVRVEDIRTRGHYTGRENFRQTHFGCEVRRAAVLTRNSRHAGRETQTTFEPNPMMQNELSLNYLAILAATVSTFLLGGLWYSPLMFGAAWMQEVGVNPEAPGEKEKLGRIMGVSFVLELIMAFNLAAFMGAKSTWMFGAAAGAAAGFGWVALSLGVTYLFERRSLRLFFINAGYHGVAFTIMGAILGAWH